MSVLARLRQQRPDIHWQGALISAAETLLPGGRGWLPRWLTARGAQKCGACASSQACGGRALVPGGVQTDTGEHIEADIVLWATGAVGQTWLQRTALPLDEKGFISVDEALQVTGQRGIFAAGDCAALRSSPLPKAGVYAVRMGPALAENLRAACHGLTLTPVAASVSRASTDWHRRRPRDCQPWVHRLFGPLGMAVETADRCALSCPLQPAFY